MQSKHYNKDNLLWIHLLCLSTSLQTQMHKATSKWREIKFHFPLMK